jgi:hypothetical protein
MDIETIGLIIATVLGIFGTVGGIPQIIKWSEPRPHLKINKLKILWIRDHHYGLSYEIENQTKFYTRDADATTVMAEITEWDKNFVQWDSSPFIFQLTGCLVAGTKFVETRETCHIAKPEGHPYMILFKVYCDEKAIAKQKIRFVKSN